MPVFDTAHLTPTEVLAGDTAEFIIHLTVGEAYTPDASRLIFDFPATLGMSRPSRMHQEEGGFVTARVSNPDVTYHINIWDMEIRDFASKTKRSWRGMACRMAVLDLGPGLHAGDTLEVRWGDTGGGYGAGTKVTTVVPRKDYACTIHVRYFTDPQGGLPDMGRSTADYDRPIPDEEIPLQFQVRPRVPHHLRLLRKHDEALLAPHDVFWNVADVESAEGLVDTHTPPAPNAHGVFRFADPHVQVESRALPMTESPAMDGVFEDYNLYWGDVHTHSAFSVDCVEREKMDMSPGDLMRAARLRAGLDFYAATDHHQPQDPARNHIGADNWRALIDAVAAHHEPGAFVTFPGIEYRCTRGDTVVLFNWLPDYGEINRASWTDVRALWQALEGQDYLTIPHFHNPGRLEPSEWWQPDSDPNVEPVLEIFSCHGSYEREDARERHIPLIKASRPDRYGAHFLREGYRYGFVCNSDGHKGHVGTNGLTAVFAKALTREAILDAYRRRHVYGTTNARIRLIVTGNGHLMGDVVPNTPDKRLEIDVVGENRLKRIDLYRNAELYRRIAPEGKRFHDVITVQEAPPSHWYVRVTQIDNHIAYSSPIWYE